MPLAHSKFSLVIATLVALTSVRASAEEPAQAVAKWEYKIVLWQGGDTATQEVLNALGSEGWECIGAVSRSSGERLILKRPKQAAHNLHTVLEQKITFAWKEGTLENALKALAAKVKTEHPKFDIEILGDDLKAEGITRNKHLSDLTFNDASVTEVLTALMMKANSIPGVKDASRPDQKLIFIYAGKPNEHTVLITTRPAAEKRGDKLPKVFEPK